MELEALIYFCRTTEWSDARLRQFAPTNCWLWHNTSIHLKLQFVRLGDMEPLGEHQLAPSFLRAKRSPDLGSLFILEERLCKTFAEFDG